VSADKLNAPPRLSDLHGDERRAALVARHAANRDRFEEVYRRNGMTNVQLILRALRGIVGKE
jgi:hypothetical protein